jgi:carbon-monoxide dehydrogenase small subunit
VKVAQKFRVGRPVAEVFAFFQDVPAVARCMPGAELTEDKGDGVFAGKVKVRLGPFGANFEGEARVSPDPATHSGRVEGKGVDRRGGSRTRMVMYYRLAPVGDGTEVTVDADVTLAGAIAQFGRTGLVQEAANILVQDFAAALERELAPTATRGAEDSASDAVTPPAAPPLPADSQAPHPAPPEKPATTSNPASRELRGGTLALRALWTWLRSLFRGLLGAGKRH